MKDLASRLTEELDRATGGQDAMERVRDVRLEAYTQDLRPLAKQVVTENLLDGETGDGMPRTDADVLYDNINKVLSATHQVRAENHRYSAFLSGLDEEIILLRSLPRHDWDDRLIVYGDVHGDLKSQHVVAEQPATTRVCLGDLVNWGNAYPERLALQEALALNDVVIRGDHEQKLIDNSQSASLAALAHKTQKTYRDGRFIFMHELPAEVDDKWAAREFADNHVHDGQQPVLFYGHTHKPLAQRLTHSGKVDDLDIQEPIVLDEQEAYFINPGKLSTHNSTPSYISVEDRTVLRYHRF